MNNLLLMDKKLAKFNAITYVSSLTAWPSWKFSRGELLWHTINQQKRESDKLLLKHLETEYKDLKTEQL